MPQGNYLNAFSGPNLAEIDRSAYSNSLLKNDVARLPQSNRAEDLAIQGDEQAINQSRQANARKFLGDVFTGISQSQDPINTGRTILGNSSFQAALRDVGMDPAQFTITDQDTPESLQRQSADLARVFGVQDQAQTGIPGSLQELQAINADRASRREAPMRPEEYLAQRRGSSADSQLYAQYVQGLPGGERPLSMDQFLVQQRGNIAAAEASGKAGVIPADDRITAQNKQPRVEAAMRRLDRVSQASAALDNNRLSGGPMQGRVIGLTEEGNELDQANAQLLTELTALTRTPGLGSQSDFEQRLAQLVLPTADMYPSVRAKALAELRSFMQDLGYQIQKIGSGAQQGGGLPDFSQMTDAQLQQIINGQ